MVPDNVLIPPLSVTFTSSTSPCFKLCEEKDTLTDDLAWRNGGYVRVSMAIMQIRIYLFIKGVRSCIITLQCYNARPDPLRRRELHHQLFRLVPALDSLRKYSPHTLYRDLMAGLTVATVAVPQAMAYAAIAGIPVKYGLYTALVMTAVGALFDSSKQLINGPTNAISIAVLSALVPFADHEKIPMAILLALLVGLIQTGITLFRLGDLSRYISNAVIVGFTTGAAALLVLDQLKNLIGLKGIGAPHDHFLKRFWLTITTGGPVHTWTLALGIGTIILILCLRWLNKLLRFRMPAS